MKFEEKIKQSTHKLVTPLAIGMFSLSLGYAVACGEEEPKPECVSAQDCVERCQMRAQDGREFDQCKQQGWYCGRWCGERTYETERGTRIQAYCENACMH